MRSGARSRASALSRAAIRVGTLDEPAEAIRKKTVWTEDTTALPHWNVEPWAGPVDGAALLNSIKQTFRHKPKMPDLNDRAADNWRPLLAIDELAGGTWPKEAAGCLPTFGPGAGWRHRH